jgi:hypothetical protein
MLLVLNLNLVRTYVQAISFDIDTGGNSAIGRRLTLNVWLLSRNLISVQVFVLCLSHLPFCLVSFVIIKTGTVGLTTSTQETGRDDIVFRV